ncbi:ribosome recycling factor family protein [Vibrio sp.]|uniref:ribosome recycling factor family protein n=1 Tax=Vibrio sp. TaxID=678 RepID=UPI003AA8DEB9
MANKKTQSELPCIALPSLIHRIGGENCKYAKAIAAQHQCELKRIRRSRNWQISGNSANLAHLLSALQAEQNQGLDYLINKLNTGLLALNDKPESKAEQLASLIAQQPDITLNELMAATNCTMIEARVARFNSQDFE